MSLIGSKSYMLSEKHIIKKNKYNKRALDYFNIEDLT
jgi:hypothetical protein